MQSEKRGSAGVASLAQNRWTRTSEQVTERNSSTLIEASAGVTQFGPQARQ